MERGGDAPAAQNCTPSQLGGPQALNPFLQRDVGREQPPAEPAGFSIAGSEAEGPAAAARGAACAAAGAQLQHQRCAGRTVTGVYGTGVGRCFLLHSRVCSAARGRAHNIEMKRLTLRSLGSAAQKNRCCLAGVLLGGDGQVCPERGRFS